MIPDTPEQLHLKEASELQSNVSGADMINKHPPPRKKQQHSVGVLFVRCCFCSIKF